MVLVSAWGRKATKWRLQLLSGYLAILCSLSLSAAEPLAVVNQAAPTQVGEAASAEVAIHALLDGLHADAANARFDAYFARYTTDAVFLGTDRSERWSIDEFKAYAKPIFDDGRGWTYWVLERNLEGASTGDLRWFDEVLSNEKLGLCRGTGVVIRTAQGWRIAHYALSMLIPNPIAEQVGAQSKGAS